MNYAYRVTLSGIKGFFRVYHISGKNTLYTFHKQLRDDLEFPADQPILFKALDEAGNVVQRWALVDLGAGTVDVVTIEDSIKAGVKSFVYFYDIKSKKSVNITFEGEVEDDVTLPTLMEVKGPIPLEFEHGYVAFEDLPEDHRKIPPRIASSGGDDDDDLDDDDEEGNEDEDKEEEELVYDSEE